MSVLDTSYFGVVDFCVFVAVLLISLGIGVYTSYIGSKSPEEFLMGNRSFGSIPIAMSLLTSFVSAISLLGYTGEAYAHGMQVSTFVLGVGLGIIVSAFVTIPVIFPLKLTSVNEYLELRFKSSRIRNAVMVITSIKGVIFMGVCLYAPTIALGAVTPLSSISYIFILGGVVTLYSTIGGIRAVVWTDVFQLTVMVVGALVIVIAGLVEVGGLGEVWRVAAPGGRLDIFNMSLSLYERHTFWNTVAYGVVVYSALYGVSQINVQRLCSVPHVKDVYRILAINAAGMFIIYVIVFGGGVIAYAIYAGCDPMSAGLIGKKEEIMPYLVVDRFRYILGLPGVFVSTLIGGALSSLSSVMSAQVAMFWEDYCVKKPFFAKMKPRAASIVTKIFSLITGLIVIGMALIASQATSLIQFSMSISGVTFGGIYGVFLLGMLFPKTNIKGVWTGLATSCVTLIVISGGSFIYGRIPVKLPFPNDQCPATVPNFSGATNNASSTAAELFHYSGVVSTTTDTPEDFSQKSFGNLWLFGISYTWYSTLGTILCVVVGLIVSKLTGDEDVRNVSPRYVTPFMRRFYWTPQQLQAFHTQQDAIPEDASAKLLKA